MRISQFLNRGLTPSSPKTAFRYPGIHVLAWLIRYGSCIAGSRTRIPRFSRRRLRVVSLRTGPFLVRSSMWEDRKKAAIGSNYSFWLRIRTLRKSLGTMRRPILPRAAIRALIAYRKAYDR